MQVHVPSSDELTLRHVVDAIDAWGEANVNRLTEHVHFIPDRQQPCWGTADDHGTDTEPYVLDTVRASRGVVLRACMISSVLLCHFSRQHVWGLSVVVASDHPRWSGRG